MHASALLPRRPSSSFVGGGRINQPAGPKRTAISASNSNHSEPPNSTGPSRRDVLGTVVGGAALSLLPPLAAPATSLAASLADFTPPVAQAPGPLPAREQQIIDLYKGASTGVVNVFDQSILGRNISSLAADIPEGNGTGVVFDKERKLILTNYHVLPILDTLSKQALAELRDKPIKVGKVTLTGEDGEAVSTDAFLVGCDRTKDLAVLRVEVSTSRLVPLTFGTSKDLRVGQAVYAVGNPFGFEKTLTSGVISAVNRDIYARTGNVIAGGIQTDCPLNPGNSGGPLLSTDGRVIGISTAIYSSTGTNQGLGFALPIDLVLRVLPELVEKGRIERASLRVQVAPEGVARQLRAAEGAMIQSVTAGSSAERSGLMSIRRGLAGVVAGDVIVSINGKPVRRPGDVQILIDDMGLKPGQEAEVGIIRSIGSGDEQRAVIKVKLDSE